MGGTSTGLSADSAVIYPRLREDQPHILSKMEAMGVTSTGLSADSAVYPRLREDQPHILSKAEAMVEDLHWPLC